MMSGVEQVVFSDPSTLSHRFLIWASRLLIKSLDKKRDWAYAVREDFLHLSTDFARISLLFRLDVINIISHHISWNWGQSAKQFLFEDPRCRRLNKFRILGVHQGDTGRTPSEGISWFFECWVVRINVTISFFSLCLEIRAVWCALGSARLGIGAICDGFHGRGNSL